MDNKEKKIVSSVIWGVSALIGFFVTERLHEAGVKLYEKKKEDEEIEEIFEAEAEESL